MPQFEVKRVAFGPNAPGGVHELLPVGTIVVAETLPGDAYEALDNGEVASVASPAAVAAATKRAASAAKSEAEE